MADVTFQHPSYKEAYARWELVEDAAAGEMEVKDKGELYLPKPNPADTSLQNRERYKHYLMRAVYYNATGRTRTSLVGFAFSKEPALDAPGLLDYVSDDIDGSGLSIYQQSQKVLAEVLTKGRACLLADFPRTSGAVSVADMRSGMVRATLTQIEAERVINWQTTKVGARHVLSLVVIRECASEITEDGFGFKEIDQYRVLRLVDIGCTVEIWRKNERDEWVIYEPAQTILDGSGNPLHFIPLVFVGAQDNSAEINDAPLYDLAVLNLAHYRNSADYEDSVYMVGQPQGWIGGLTEDWRDWLQKNGVYLGSRSVMLLPSGGSFGIAQAQPNTLAKEAMDAKEEQMRALGARLIQPGSAVKTATQAQGEQESEHSVLSLAAANVSEAYTQALGWMALFMGVAGSPSYTLQVDLGQFTADSQLIGALISANQAGKLPDSELWSIFRRLQLISPAKTDEMLAEELGNQTGGNTAGFGAA